MTVPTVLADLRMNRDFMSQVVAWERIPARRARLGEWPSLHPDLRAALDTAGIDQLFTHQTAAINAAQAGEDVVIATRTASGKSLCYTVPIMQRLLDEPNACALYLFPTKALAQDQYAATQRLIDQGNLPIEAGIYDGDTPKHMRSKIRKSSGILISNPDMLHAGIMPYHPSWRTWFRNLRYIVVDEIHTYRGVFGSHVANVLRRLLRLCSFYGSRPQFICCSATIANPQEHANKLTSAKFTLVDESQNGAPQGEKSFILYNTPVIDETLGIRQSILLSAMDAAFVFLREGVQTVTFARSRHAVEVLLGYLRDQMDYVGESADLLTGYRAGYLPLERREIERGLRDGSLRGVVATTALELGVDIGALDAAVLTGYPGTIASVWQQAGRAGRRDEPSAVIMVAGNSPLDQYICRHPRYLFGSSPEHALINPNNLPIMVQHLQCAAFELPFIAGEPWGDFGPVDDLLTILDGNTIHKTQNQFHYLGEGTPSHTFSLRTSGSNTVVIQALSERGGEPRVIGEVDRQSAPVIVYEGAVYMHQAETFLVDTLDWEGGVANVIATELDYYTRPTVSSEIRELRPATEKRIGGLLHAHGELLVVTQATGFRKVKRYSHESLGYGKIELPPWHLDTSGYWMVFGEKLTAQMEAVGIFLAANDYGPNWQEQRRKALDRDGNQCRNCGSTELLHVHHLRPFRDFGYVVGVNDNYRKANEVKNLATLCPRCHRQAEASVQARSALSGLAYVLRNLAPLFLMCAPTDVQVSAESRNPLVGAPMIVIYENTPAGVGFSERLFALHDQLLDAALELVQDCNCRDGCPACVGPPGEIGPNTKAATHQLIKVIRKG